MVGWVDSHSGVVFVSRWVSGQSHSNLHSFVNLKMGKRGPKLAGTVNLKICVVKTTLTYFMNFNIVLNVCRVDM